MKLIETYKNILIRSTKLLLSKLITLNTDMCKSESLQVMKAKLDSLETYSKPRTFTCTQFSNAFWCCWIIINHYIRLISNFVLSDAQVFVKTSLNTGKCSCNAKKVFFILLV